MVINGNRVCQAAHGETEELRAKQRELTTNLRAAEQENKELSDVMAALKDKIHLLGKNNLDSI